ncbi:MAG: ABC transporter ATP-binding protein [Catonella sp.]|uniref:ABC transporter ATP-binding protein n=1 Tax=Catonella sp. TaxID=2382125 RepID=UPI003F9FF513
MENMIKADKLTFYYEQSKDGIKDINFNIKAGEVILLAGDSGSGKSTLLKCLNGLIPETVEGSLEGSLFFEDKKYTELKMFELNKHIGSVFQNPRSQFFTTNSTAELVFPMENYGYAKEEMDERLTALTEKFSLHPLLNRNIFEISSGERQLLALASALALNQKAVIFDEPSANLDYGNAMRLGKIIADMKNAGITVIVADHRFYYLSGLIDRVFLVEEGRIKQFDSEEEFKKSTYDTRSFDLFDLELPLPYKSTNVEKIASLKNVIYKDILTGVSLELNKGEVTVLVGNNGVGKTTLAKLLCRTLKPDNGEINCKELPFYIMQDPDFQLFGTSVYNELALVNNNKEKIEETLSYLGLYSYKDKHPFDLSGGQKQRLQIGMAMLCDKPLIIFDEPTSGLDIVSMKKVAKEIVRLKKDAAVIVISHDYEFIRNVANRIIYLKSGNVYEDFELTDNTLCKLNNIFTNMEVEKDEEQF